MSFETDLESKLLGDFNLLCSLLAPEQKDEFRPPADLSKLQEIIDKKIPDALSKNAPPDYYTLYTDFLAEFEKLRDYILYDRLIGKCVVALGGGFSSGKSTFLNTLMGMDILPMKITPTTAVPTYLICDSENSVEAINIFDVKVHFQELSDIQKVSHDFGRIEENGKVKCQGTALGQVLESIFVTTPEQTYQNIAFLDTPGYSKADSEYYSARTDEQIARRQLNTANLILWFVNSANGDIGKNDIDFLHSLRPGIPMAVVLTRAGGNPDAVERIREKVKNSLTINRLEANCLGVFAYERDDPESFNMSNIKALLEEQNQAKAEPDFAVNFKRLFIRCNRYCEEELNRTRRQLEHLNSARMQIGSANSQADEALEQLGAGVSREQNSLTALQKTVRTLQREFFQELKQIGDQVGIHMPEPEDSTLWKEDAGDPLSLLREYNESKNIKHDPTLADILREKLDGVEPVMARGAGSGEHKDALLKILVDNCRVSPSELRFGDLNQKLQGYRELIKTLNAQIET